ncbi:MAG: DUF374 domain-containing protein [Candidatus Sumerlaeia bacterium]|nr:DUF374 domain-containing protein [Candidatus Sumerlaeia bacterium]
MNKGTKRKIKFFLIRTFLLPLIILVMKILARTWRLDPDADPQVQKMMEADRALMAVCHGCFPTVIPYSILARRMRRPLTLMTSPSKDGHLLDIVVRSFGIDVVKGSSASRAVSGSRSLIQAVRDGKLGILAIDGPRGPRAVPKPGYLALTAATEARFFLVTASASGSFKFKSWDRMFIPHPFARIKIRVAEHTPRLHEGETDAEAILRLQQRILSDARELNSPIAVGLADAPETREIPRP